MHLGTDIKFPKLTGKGFRLLRAMQPILLKVLESTSVQLTKRMGILFLTEGHSSRRDIHCETH